jgi:tetratricopeptide (TPR) repeat protein
MSLPRTFVRNTLAFVGVCILLFSSCKSKQVAGGAAEGGGGKGLTEREQLDFSFLFFEASKEKMLGNTAPAIQKYNQAVRINPRNSACHYELSQLYLAAGLLDQAEISGALAVKFDPENIWYKLSLSEVYEQRRKYDKLLPLIKAVADSDPANPEYQYSLANAYSVNGRFADAIAIFDKLEKQYGVSEEFTVQKKSLYLQLKKPEKAVAEVQKLIDAYPDEASYLGFLAEIYSASGDKEKALKTYEEIVKRDPANTTVYYALAQFYQENKENEKSYDALKKAVSNPDADIDPKFEVLASYFELSRQYPELTPQALELCQLTIQAHPESARARAAYGDFLYRENKLAEAREQYVAVLRLDPSIFGVWNQLLMITSELNEFQMMYEKSAEAMELFPSSAVFYLYRGVAAMQLKKFDDAVQALNTGAPLVVENNALSSQFYASLGDCYHTLKKHEESDASYEKALTYDASNIYVMNNYAYYLSVRKVRLDRALELSSRSNELQPNNASFLDTKAWIYYVKGDYENAAVWIDKALEHGGMRSGTILEHKGDILFRKGKADDALDFWKRAKEVGGGSEHLEQKINSKNLME